MKKYSIRSPWNEIISFSEAEKQEIKQLIKIILQSILAV